jgi:pentatricopeptide repeat protein
MHGRGREALKYFELMCEEVLQPDDITFVCLLSACSHAGLVDEGMHLYASMFRDYMIPAKLEHYTYMVHLSWPCWPSTGGKEFYQCNALYTLCGYMDGFAWCLHN